MYNFIKYVHSECLVVLTYQGTFNLISMSPWSNWLKILATCDPYVLLSHLYCIINLTICCCFWTLIPPNLSFIYDVLWLDHTSIPIHTLKGVLQEVGRATFVSWQMLLLKTANHTEMSVLAVEQLSVCVVDRDPWLYVVFNTIFYGCSDT